MGKHALCIGINDYPGTDSDLAGCVNDADDWAAELRQRGFDVRRLLDGQATLAAMREAMAALIRQASEKGRYRGHHLFRPRHLGAGQLR